MEFIRSNINRVGFRLGVLVIVGVALVAATMPQAIAKDIAMLQEVTYSTGTKQFSEQHLWYITERAFRLHVDAPQYDLLYFMSGRNLLACVKLKAETKFEARKSGISETVMKAIYDGVCMTPPSHVVVSFFISPLHAASLFDFTESVRLNFDLVELEKKELKSATAKGATDCDKEDRKFRFQYVNADGRSMSHQGEESLCVNNDANWRRPVWQLLSRLLTQQGQEGLSIRRKIEQSGMSNSGLRVSGDARYVLIDAKSRIELKAGVVTKKTERLKIDPAYFRVPKGYRMLSELSQEMQKASTPGAAKKHRTDDDSAATSALMEALRLLIRGSTPLP